MDHEAQNVLLRWELDTSHLYDHYSKIGNEYDAGKRPAVVVWKNNWRDQEWTKSYRKSVNKSGMMMWDTAEVTGYSPLPDEITSIEDALAYAEIMARMA